MGHKQWQTMLDVHCTAPFKLIQVGGCQGGKKRSAGLISSPGVAARHSTCAGVCFSAEVQAAAPYMREAAKAELQQAGRACPRCILNISSVSGVHGSAGQVGAPVAAYCSPPWARATTASSCCQA